MLFRRRYHGEEMYQTVDVHGGHTGIPVWMTEACWQNLKLSTSPRVSLKAIQEIQSLLKSLKSLSSESSKLSSEGLNDAKSKAKSSATKAESN